jgi:stress response protein SCP2
MGIVKGSFSFNDDNDDDDDNVPQTKWMKVEKESGFTKEVTGELEVRTSIMVSKNLTAIRGNRLSLDGGIINVVSDYEVDGYNIDLVTNCVPVDSNGKILMKETVNSVKNSNGSIQHSQSVSSEGGDFNHGDIIRCKLDSIRNHIHALYFILTVSSPNVSSTTKSFENVKSASVSVVNEETKWTMCKFTPSLVGGNSNKVVLLY